MGGPPAHGSMVASGWTDQESESGASMAMWIALLRAVNVGGRPFPMARLREILTDAGYADVATHIQTGNVRFGSPARSATRLAAMLEELFLADRGFPVATFVLTPGELSAIAADAARVAARHTPSVGHYVSVLDAPPTGADARRIENLSRDRERVVVAGRAVHLLYDLPYHEARTSNAAIERIVGRATNRNARVIADLAAKWGAG